MTALVQPGQTVLTGRLRMLLAVWIEPAALLLGRHRVARHCGCTSLLSREGTHPLFVERMDGGSLFCRLRAASGSDHVDQRSERNDTSVELPVVPSSVASCGRAQK